MLGILRISWRQLRRRPWRVCAAFVVITLTLSAGGVHLWVWHQYQQAELALEEENYEAARDSLKTCLRIWWWQTADTYFLAARLERLTGHYVQAELFLEKSIQLRGRADEAAQLEAMLGQVERGQGPTIEPTLWALTTTTQAESPLILRTLAKVTYDQWRFQLSLVVLNKWIQVRPQSAEALYWRGLVWQKMYDDGNAQKDFRKALELAPHRADIRFSLAQVLLQNNEDPQEILNLLQSVSQQQPNKPEVLVALGRAKTQLGDLAEARLILDQALQVNPNHIGALHFRAKLEYEAGDFAAAESWARKAVAQVPINPLSLFLLADSLKKQKQPQKKQEAEIYYQKFQKAKEDAEHFKELVSGPYQQNPENPDVLAEMGGIFLRNGQEAAGLHYLEKALSHNSQHQPARELLNSYALQKKTLKSSVEPQKSGNPVNSH